MTPGQSPKPDAFRSAVSIREAVASGQTSVRAVVEETLRRIDALEPQVDAFLHVEREGSLARADALDARIRAGDAEGALLGVPVAVKDNICVEGQPATCASRILQGYRPPYDATVVARLLEAGAVIVGKTNLDEFAMGSSCENSAFKKTKNPWDTTRVPGGSSGGSAAAVAAGMVPLALGSETGGSVRQPAALCGLVGFKPTYGSVSRYGLIAFASSLDTVAPFGATVRDVALLQSVIAGVDPRDATTLPNESRDLAATLSPDLSDLRIGVHRDFLDDLADAEIRGVLGAAVDKLREAGARIVRVDDADLLSRHALATYYLVATSEASSNLARFDGMRYGARAERQGLLETYESTRGEGFGAEVKRRILLGTFALSSGYYDAYYKKALQVRRRLREAYDRVFERCDLLVGGTSPIPAFPLGQKVQDPLTMYQCDVLTIPASLTGLPAVSVPCGLTGSGLPVGLQIVGPPLEDARVLSAAFAFEQRSGWKGKLAPLAETAA